MDLVLMKRRGEAGFSIIEVLIAAGLLLVIAVGVIPLFTSAMVSTVGGAESTAVSNYGKSEIEEILRIPLDNAAVQIPGGATELKTEEYWSLRDEQWKPGTPSGADPGLWLRTTTIKQYNITTLTEDATPGVIDNPLDGNAPVGNVHLKEITVKLESTRQGGPLAKGKELTLTTVKEF